MLCLGLGLGLTLTVPPVPPGLVVMGMLGFYWGEAQAQSLHAEWDSLLSSVVLYLPSVAHIVYTNALGTAYRQVALALTEFGEWGGAGAPLE